MFGRVRDSEKGFSLIETLAAITVFGLISVGMTPLIVSSIRGTSLSRSQTVARNLVSEAMERIRGLPFYNTSANRDFLDFYFPNLGTGYSAGVFTTTCTETTQTPAATGALACPPPHPGTTDQRLPEGYEVRFAARFVQPTGTTTETYVQVDPPATYDSASEATSIPPTQLVEVTVTAAWTQIGELREFSLTSLIGDRKLSPDRVRATATVDYVFRVQTAYRQSATDILGLTGLGGRSSSDVEIRSVASASIDSGGGSLVLSREQSDVTPGEVIDSAHGAQHGQRTPPNAVPATTDGLEDDVFLPGLLGERVGFIDDTVVNEALPAPGVEVTDGFPKASSNVAFDGGVGELFWVTNQADDSASSLKLFDPFGDMFNVSRPQGSDRIEVDTKAEATATSPLSTRKVEAIAHAEAPLIALLPTVFAPGGVVRIRNFVADISCKATGAAGTSAVTGSWTASLRYYVDDTPLDNVAVGRYVPAITIGGSITPSGSVDPLAAIQDQNPLVYDGPGVLGDVYLFETALRAGYLEHWASGFDISSSVDGETSRVSLPYAVNIGTARTDAANNETKFTVDIGKLSCQSVDNRD